MAYLLDLGVDLPSRYDLRHLGDGIVAWSPAPAPEQSRYLFGADEAVRPAGGIATQNLPKTDLAAG